MGINTLACPTSFFWLIQLSNYRIRFERWSWSLKICHVTNEDRRCTKHCINRPSLFYHIPMTIKVSDTTIIISVIPSAFGRIWLTFTLNLPIYYLVHYYKKIADTQEGQINSLKLSYYSCKTIPELTVNCLFTWLKSPSVLVIKTY